jgi:hypothetical protein
LDLNILFRSVEIHSDAGSLLALNPSVEARQLCYYNVLRYRLDSGIWVSICTAETHGVVTGDIFPQG